MTEKKIEQISPKVSIVLSTFQRADLIEAAINSVLKQTYKNWELIIIDDNGVGTEKQKDTEKKVKKFSLNTISYYPLKLNKGCCGARNEGIRKSKGSLIAFFDDDDIWLPYKLEEQVKGWHKNEEAGVIFSNMIVEDSYAKNKYITDFPADYISKEQLLKRGEGICTSAIMVKKIHLEEVGYFDESLESYTDYDMLLRLSEITKSVFVKKPLLVYKVLFKGISKNMNIKYSGKSSILSKYKEIYINKNMLKEYAKHIQTLADYSVMSGFTRRSLKIFSLSIYYNPYDFKTYLKLLAAVFLGKNLNIIIRRFAERSYIKN